MRNIYCDVTLKMATPIVNWTKLEVRGVLRFLHAKGKKRLKFMRNWLPRMV